MGNCTARDDSDECQNTEKEASTNKDPLNKNINKNEDNYAGICQKYNIPELKRNNIPHITFTAVILKDIALDIESIKNIIKSTNDILAIDIIIQSLSSSSNIAFISDCLINGIYIERLAFIDPDPSLTKQDFVEILDNIKQSYKHNVRRIQQILFDKAYTERILPECKGDDFNVKMTKIKQWLFCKMNIKTVTYQNQNDQYRTIPIKIAKKFGYQHDTKENDDEKKDNDSISTKWTDLEPLTTELSDNHSKKANDFANTLIAKTDIPSFHESFIGEQMAVIQPDLSFFKKSKAVSDLMSELNIIEDPDKNIEDEHDNEEEEDNKKKAEGILYDTYYRLYYVFCNQRVLAVTNFINQLENEQKSYDKTLEHLTEEMANKYIKRIRYERKIHPRDTQKSGVSTFSIQYDGERDTIYIDRECDIKIYIDPVSMLHDKQIYSIQLMIIVTLLHEIGGHCKRYLCTEQGIHQSLEIYSEVPEYGDIIERYSFGCHLQTEVYKTYMWIPKSEEYYLHSVYGSVFEDYEEEIWSLNDNYIYSHFLVHKAVDLAMYDFTKLVGYCKEKQIRDESQMGIIQTKNTKNRPSLPYYPCVQFKTYRGR